MSATIQIEDFEEMRRTLGIDDAQLRRFRSAKAYDGRIRMVFQRARP